MAYQTGTALHVDDLLGQLDTFLQSNGWTQDKVVAGSGDGHSSEYYWSKGNCFVSIEAYNTTGNQWYHGVFSSDVEDEGINLWGNTGFNGGSAVDAQPGTCDSFNGGCKVNFLLPNMTAYHFFTDPAKTYCHVVVETTANEFRHIIFGTCNKLGAYDGGEYVMSHYHENNQFDIDQSSDLNHRLPFQGGGNSSFQRNVFRFNIDGVLWKQAFFATPFSSWWMPMQGHSTQGNMMEILWNGTFPSTPIAAPNDFNGLSPFFNIPVGWMVRSSTSYLPAGHIEDVRFVNVENITPGATLTLGSDDWLVFPVTEKKLPSQQDELPNTGYNGLAYLKVP